MHDSFPLKPTLDQSRIYGTNEPPCAVTSRDGHSVHMTHCGFPVGN